MQDALKDSKEDLANQSISNTQVPNLNYTPGEEITDEAGISERLKILTDVRKSVLDAIQDDSVTEEALREKAELTQEQLIARYRHVAEVDIREVLSWKDGRVTLKDADQISAAAGYAIQEMQQTVSKDGQPQFKVKLYDRLEALNALAKHLGFFAKVLGQGRWRWKRFETFRFPPTAANCSIGGAIGTACRTCRNCECVC